MEGVPGHQTPLQLSSPPCSPPSSPCQHPPSPPLGPQSPPPTFDFDQTDSEDGCQQDLLVEDEFPPAIHPRIRTSLEFVELVGAATLASQFDPQELAAFLNPEEHESTPLDDPNLTLYFLNFILLLSSSQDTYDKICNNIQWHCPSIELLLYYQVEWCTRSLTGLVLWEHHMCIWSCVGFTGLCAHLESCLCCGEPRYDQKELRESNSLRRVPQKVFTMFPIGLQLQACWKHPQTAKDMFYQWEKTEELL